MSELHAKPVDVVDLVSSDEESEVVSSNSKRQRRTESIQEMRATTKPATLNHPQKSKGDSNRNGTGQSESKRPCGTSFLNLDTASGGDSASVTDGILPALRMRVSSDTSRTSTCNVDGTLFIGQRDDWSCGFRNTQMMLSALLPMLPMDHPYFTNIPSSLKPCAGTSSLIPIPSLSELQSFIERSWSDGFDADGARHYNHELVGTKVWIGAVEVSTTLAYLNVDSVVVQFIKCASSRRLLGPYVWTYFQKASSAHFPDCERCQHRTSDAAARACLRLTSETRETIANCALSQPGCTCPIFPLYLQWEGHSVTVVGIERKGPQDEFDLLVFDPMKDGSKMKTKLRDEAAVPPPMRLPASRLLQKDCQLVMCSTHPLPESERLACKGQVDSLTAALQDVLETIQR